MEILQGLKLRINNIRFKQYRRVYIRILMPNSSSQQSAYYTSEEVQGQVNQAGKNVY
jgi:hypothetical protein